ncbi:MAG: hypothetical protein V3R71_06380 [Gemmatimonadales bacterium]
MTRRKDSGLYVSRPDHVEDPLWLDGLSMAADTDYPSQDCREFGTVWLEFIISPTDDPVGDLFIEWSMDGVTFYAFIFDIGKFSTFGPGLTVDELTGKISVADPVTEARFSLGIEKPPPFLRGRWDFTAGSATGMSGKSFGRG